MLTGPTGPRACTVVGSPIAHSLSPVLHRAAYDDLGLTDWVYTRREVPAGSLAGFCAQVARDGLDGLPVGGISVTMPGKQEALALADLATPRASAVRAANTLLPTYDGASVIGWRADNTDVAGIIGALGEVGLTSAAGLDCVIVGAGGTAGAAVAALAALGADGVRVVARSAARAEPVVHVGAAVGLPVRIVPWDELTRTACESGLVVSTVPSGAADELGAALLAAGVVVLDAVYANGSTPLLEQTRARGGDAVDGVWMLLHQAVEQVELMTGRRPDVAVMRAALERHRP